MNKLTLCTKPTKLGKQSVDDFSAQCANNFGEVTRTGVFDRCAPAWTCEHVDARTIDNSYSILRNGRVTPIHSRRVFRVGEPWEAKTDPFLASFWQRHLWRLRMEADFLGCEKTLIDAEPTAAMSPCAWMKGIGTDFQIPLGDLTKLENAVRVSNGPMANYVFPGCSKKARSYVHAVNKLGLYDIATPYGVVPGPVQYHGNPPIRVWTLFVGPKSDPKNGILTPKEALAFEWDKVEAAYPGCERWWFCNWSTLAETMKLTKEAAG